VRQVQDGRQESRQARTGKNCEQKLQHRKHRDTQVGLDGTRRTGNRQTENTGINTQEIMGTNGVETSTRQVKQNRVRNK
jgi:hypothetical protein